MGPRLDGYLDGLEDVALCLGVGGVLLVPGDGGLLEDLHRVDLPLVLRRDLPHLEHLEKETEDENDNFRWS